MNKPMSNIQILEKHFKNGMINKDFNSFQRFQRAYPTLLKCILNAMNEVSVQKDAKPVCKCGKGNAWTWDEMNKVFLCSYCGRDEKLIQK